MNTRSTAHIAVLTTNLFFAGNLSLVKHISPEKIGPYGLNIVRVGGSLVLFWLFWFFERNTPAIRRKDLPRLIACGLFGVAINQMLFIKGLTLTSTIHASLLMMSTPLLITFFAFWILKERITLSKVAGLILGIGGAAMLILAKEQAGTASWRGDMLIVCNAIAYTFYFILVKPLMQDYPPLQVIRWVFTFGLLFILPFGWQQFDAVDWSQSGWSHLTSLATIVCCGTFLAYSFNAFGIKHLGAGTAGSYIYTQPLFAAVIALLFLDERLTTEKLVAGALIFLGVFLASRKVTPPIGD